ncbi:hypothetical protein [Paraburkholderia unamae]|uniref:Uncharacterized protein n=1 Tax=Paraburkholderia unamae TaxID=219649 RepID=A0ABX5KCY2_9BURK|nr:hypothetical protein [Paraburkholderia unamae]PVX62709.1 hypothetical protein C7402_13916 [Paraburkholderia unamae]
MTETEIKAIQPEPFDKIGRPLRRDDWRTLGESTERLLCEAIDAGDAERAKALVRYALNERKPVHDLSADWVWDSLTRIAQRWGEDAVGEMLRDVQSTWMLRRTWKAFLKMTVEERAQLCAEMMRSHAFTAEPGANGVTVEEDDEKYTIRLDPCGSGGRMRRGDPADGSPSRLGPPYEFGVTAQAHDWSWGQENVPYYCAHCAVNEILPMEWGGHPLWVTAFDPDASRPCAWLLYKKAEAIPVHFYERVGRQKPPAGEGQY